MIIALAGHELDSIGNIYINDEVVALDGSGVVISGSFLNKIRIKKHLGTATQTVDPDLLAESGQIGSSFRGQGIAYFYVRLDYDNDVFANGIPLFTAMVRGKKVYDPRSGTTAYSANAALCARDYFLAGHGLGDTAVNLTVFSASANVCDELVYLDDGGTESRYEMNGVIRADQSVGKVLQSMITCCAGSLFWGQGEWQLRVGYYSPAVKIFTLDDLRGSIAIETRVNIRDNFNGVAGTFNDAAQDYITADYQAITSAAFLAEDHGDALSLFRVIDVEDGDYDFRARSSNGLGYSSDWEYLSNIAAAANNTPPADVTGFSAEVNGATTYLEWDAVADLDLSYYRIRHAVETTGATWANATTAIDKVPRPATSAPLSVRPEPI